MWRPAPNFFDARRTSQPTSPADFLMGAHPSTPDALYVPLPFWFIHNSRSLRVVKALEAVEAVETPHSVGKWLPLVCISPAADIHIVPDRTSACTVWAPGSVSPRHSTRRPDPTQRQFGDPDSPDVTLQATPIME